MITWEICRYDSKSWILLTRFTPNIFLYFVYQWNTKLYVSRWSSYYAGEFAIRSKRDRSFISPAMKSKAGRPHARRFSFKFVNTEITIEYAKQHQRPPRNSCVSGYTTLCKARKNQRDYYMGQKTLARSYSALQFSEQPRGMKYSIIRRYCKLDSRFPATLVLRKNNNTDSK